MFVIATLVVASATAFVKPNIASDFFVRFGLLTATTVVLGFVSATLGSILGVGAALFTIEVAGTGVRQTIKALIGALHAVPAVGFGIAAAGALLFSAKPPSVFLTLLLAALVLSFMIASVVFVQMRRELARLPEEMRDAAAATGADSVQITMLAVLPALQRRIAGIWWSSIALALGEATALQVIFASASAKIAGGFAVAALQGTIASALLQVGAAARDAGVIGLAPSALFLLVIALAAVALGQRATGYVPWP